jgi:hypothetical protein
MAQACSDHGPVAQATAAGVRVRGAMLKLKADMLISDMRRYIYASVVLG